MSAHIHRRAFRPGRRPSDDVGVLPARHSRGLGRGVLLGLWLLGAACTSPPPQRPAPAGSAAAAERADEATVIRPRGLLPAYALPWETERAAKADEPDSYRSLHPDWYAVTIPPEAGTFRVHREWEAVQALLLAPADYAPGITQTLVDIGVACLDPPGGGGPVTRLVLLGGSELDLAWYLDRLVGAGLPRALVDAYVLVAPLPTDSLWLVDYGPLPLVRLGDAPSLAFLDFRYYVDRALDDAVPTRLGQFLGATTYRAAHAGHFEGGNFQSDGAGTCFTTQRQLDYSGGTSADFEATLAPYTGCERWVWLYDIPADATGHVDMFFRLVGPHTAVLGEFTERNGDPAATAAMERNAEILAGVVMPDGSDLAVHRMPHPTAAAGDAGPVPLSYLNSTLVNGGSAGRLHLWPTYDRDPDLHAAAADVWQAVLPEYTHVAIPADDMALWSGAIHCVTRTLPLGDWQPWVPQGHCTDQVCAGVADGYAFGCRTDTDCVGPAWLCTCSDCAECPLVPCGSLPPCAPGLRCEAGQCVEPGCGAGPACAADEWCVQGRCVTNPCAPPWSLGLLGCCDGDAAIWCDPTADPPLQVVDCALSYRNTCGWDPDDLYYYCTAAPEADPSGVAPRACPWLGSCEPDCADRVCGSDGCGGVCGSCPAGQACRVGACAVCGCTPDQQCGDNGCGSSCGECLAGQVCSAGRCIAPLPFACRGYETASAPGCPFAPGFEGCCYPTGQALWCEDGQTFCLDCAASGALCGWDAINRFYNCDSAGAADPAGLFPRECGGCTPDCGARRCGPDPQGCGSSCGHCATGQRCRDGVCVAGCAPDCAARECGDDGCGGSCGACPAGLICEQHRCVAGCRPACAGRACGDDGCGGSCGECPSGTHCRGGQCTTECGHECLPGSVGCAADGLSRWTCVLDEAAGCYQQVHARCSPGAPCVDGQCAGGPGGDAQGGSDATATADVADAPRRGSGCQAGAPRQAATAGLLGTLLLLLCLRGARRPGYRTHGRGPAGRVPRG